MTRRAFYNTVSPKDAEKAEDIANMFAGRVGALNSMLAETYGVDLKSYGGEALPVVLGSSTDMSHIGPLIINADGTTRRISNWAQLTKKEQEVSQNTFQSSHNVSVYL